MPTTLTTVAVEQSTYAIQATFADETGSAVVPNAGLTWSLYDEVGAIVNARTGVAVASAATVTILLSGDDLALGNGLRGRRRHVVILGTYNSTLGADLPIVEQVTFTIADLVGVT